VVFPRRRTGLGGYLDTDHRAKFSSIRSFEELRHEICGLRWDWEAQVPELETSVFIVPGDHVKNEPERYVVLNRTAKSVIEACRGELMGWAGLASMDTLLLRRCRRP
jgi:hypothetical protein